MAFVESSRTASPEVIVMLRLRITGHWSFVGDSRCSRSLILDQVTTEVATDFGRICWPRKKTSEEEQVEPTGPRENGKRVRREPRQEDVVTMAIIDPSQGLIRERSADRDGRCRVRIDGEPAPKDADSTRLG